MPEGSEATLRELLARNHRPQAPADCLVGLSGGLDSAYMLVKLVRGYGVRAEACTVVQDWSAPEAIARASELCASLGVTHHVVRPDSEKHRHVYLDYYRAWERCPSGLTANLACVQCKRHNLIPYRVASRRRLPLLVWGIAPVEVPPFIPLSFDRQGRTPGLVRAAALLVTELKRSPALRGAVLGNLGPTVSGCLAAQVGGAFFRVAYPSVQLVKFYYLHGWNRKQLAQALVADFGFPVEVERPSSWHSDCTFGPLKEYMFQMVYGADYFTAYLSNQIRHGLLPRGEGAEALTEHIQSMPDALRATLPGLGLQHLSESLDYACWERSGLPT